MKYLCVINQFTLIKYLATETFYMFHIINHLSWIITLHRIKTIYSFLTCICFQVLNWIFKPMYFRIVKETTFIISKPRFLLLEKSIWKFYPVL